MCSWSNFTKVLRTMAMLQRNFIPYSADFVYKSVANA